MADQSPADIVRHASTWSIVWGVSLILFGMLAVGSPPDPRFSRASRWQLDLEAVGWAGIFVLRRIPADASGAWCGIAYPSACFAVPD